MRLSRAIAMVLFGLTCALPAGADETSSGHQYGPTAPGWGTPNPGYPYSGPMFPGGGTVRPLPPGQATCHGYCDYVNHRGVSIIKIGNGETVEQFLQNVVNRLYQAALEDSNNKIAITYKVTTFPALYESSFDNPPDVTLQFPFLIRNTDDDRYKVNSGAAGIVGVSIYPALKTAQFVKANGGSLYVDTKCEKTTGANASVSYFTITLTIDVGNNRLPKPPHGYGDPYC